MNTIVLHRRSAFAAAVFGIFNSSAYGFFVAALIFDAVYFCTGVILWDHGAAWLITFGLFIAIVPRLINLTQVWITARTWTTRGERFDFWLNLIAIVVAIFNALVHTRDAYASMPDGLWLSLLTVVLLTVSHATAAVRVANEDNRHG
jgi:uncharacterized membrane protein